MAFRAVHAQWGTVFAHLPDLGCGQTWEAVWKVRPTPLTCDECHHPMHAKTSRNGLRFFAHAPGAPNCALALETLAHHLLKLELANAARDAGACPEMEVRGPDGVWRADVLASDPGGTWRTALEAQLAPITAADITARTERMSADGVTSIWFSDKPRPPWLGVVPSVRLARTDDGGGLVVAEGLMRYDGYWQDVPATLVQFLDWAFTGRIVSYRPRVCVRDGFATVWTAPAYTRAFDEYFAELERQVEQDRRAQEALLRSRQWTRPQIARTRAAAQSNAGEAEQAARNTAKTAAWREQVARRPDVAGAIILLDRKWGVHPATVGWSIGDPRYADGIPLFNADGALCAVLGPDPRRIRRQNFALLAGTLLLFSSRDRQADFNRVMRRYDPKPLGGWQTDSVGDY